MAADVAATQNAASPTPRCDDVFPLADTMKDGCAERCFVERDRFTRGLDPQLGLDTRHRASLRSTTSSRSLYREGVNRQPSRLVSPEEVGGAD